MRDCPHSFYFGILTATRFNYLLNHPDNVNTTITPLRHIFGNALDQYLNFAEQVAATTDTDEQEADMLGSYFWDERLEKYAEWLCNSIRIVNGSVIMPDIECWQNWQNAKAMGYI